jgi:hypothetical protein
MRDPMDPRLEAPAREAGAVDLRRDDVGVVRNANQFSRNQGRSSCAG